MKLVKTKDFQLAIGLKKLGFFGRWISSLLMRLLKIDRCNQIYDKVKYLEGIEFLDALLSELNCKYEVLDQEIERIPKQGAFITVSNHPLGGLDGVLLIKILSKARPDYKIMANFLLARVEPLSPYLFCVNPFENKKKIKSSGQGIKNALNHLKNKHPLGMFPAGQVSTYNFKLNSIKERLWQASTIRLAQKASIPIIPIYFHAKNSKLFYSISSISNVLRTALLPMEFVRKRKKVIKIRIGKPISVKEQAEYVELDQYTEFLRKKTYMLASPYKQGKAFSTIIEKIRNVSKSNQAQEVVEEEPFAFINHEIRKLRSTNTHLSSYGEYDLYFAEAEQIPHILHEIGRLREITFRDVGEGTNKSIDLDYYDTYYKHLFLWDNANRKLVGAYRMGLGAEIFPEKGINGFYVSELFHFESEIQPFFQKTIEMGRAFIRREYQQKPMPLFILWKGIVHVMLRHPEYKFLIGSVSISNQFSDFSKSVMVEFMRSHYYDPYLAQFVRPNKNYKIKLKGADKEFIFDISKADLNKFDKLIDEIEPGNLRLPVLIKKYIKQNARLIGFNVDPKFNDAIDGLAYIRISDIPKETLEPVVKELEKELKKGR